MITAFSYSRIACYAIFAVQLFVATGSLANEATRTVMVQRIENGAADPVTDALYRTVVAKISNHLQAAGFKTTQSSAPRAADTANADRDLLASLRAENTKRAKTDRVDYIALVQILADMRLYSEGTQVHVDIRGRMLDVNSSEVLAKFELPVPQTIVAPKDCNRNCILELLRANTELIANGLGTVLGERLKARD